MPKLTKRLIDATDCPTTGQVFLRDDDLRGLAVRLTPGCKTFVLEKRVRGRVRRIKLGRYGEQTLEQARDEAKKKIGEIAGGGNPAQDRRDQREEPTFGDLLDRYKTSHLPKRRPSTVRSYTGIIEQHLEAWRAYKLSDITSNAVALLHTKIGKTAPYQANRTIAVLRKMLALGVKWKLCKGENPAKGVDRFHETPRDRYVQHEEFPRLMRAIDAERDPYTRAAFKVLLFTGARTSEVLMMQWQYVFLDQAQWYIPNTKAKRSHLLPLPVNVVELLADLPRVQANPYVFIGHSTSGHLSDLSSAWSRIRKVANLPDVRVHDLRRTLGSWLAEANESLVVVGRVLNHSQPSVTARYAKITMDPMRRALDANAQRMIEAAKEKTDDAEETITA